MGVFRVDELSLYAALTHSSISSRMLIVVNQRRVYVYGERLVDRIDFEELALKSVDPSLGPKLSKFGRSEAEVSEPGTPTVRGDSSLPCIEPANKLTQQYVWS